MPKIIGVRFKNAGKVYYFDPGDYTIHYHDHVIVETARGVEYGTVVITPTEIPEEKITVPLKPLIRMADKEDDLKAQENREREKEAYHICKQKIAERGLDMKLIEAEYTFDNSKVLFYFTADGRIDFRELVKDLAGIFRTRIELRQIGVRDETKLLGGIGSCGRPLCCHTWLSEFVPVSIKMAKDQNLSLNPTKISGTCGRLMCCLKNEADTYAYLNKGMPGRGDLVTTPDGLQGDVVSVNVLRQTVKVIVEIGNDEKEMQEFEVKDITFIPKSKRPKKDNSSQKGKGEKAEKADKPEKNEKSEKADKPEKYEKAEKSERPEKSERLERSEKPEKFERQERSEKSDRNEKYERPEKFEKSEKHERSERGKRENGRKGEAASKVEDAWRREGAKGSRNEDPSRRENAKNLKGEDKERRETPGRTRKEETAKPAKAADLIEDGLMEEPAKEGGEAEKRRRRRRRPRHRSSKGEGAETNTSGEGTSSAHADHIRNERAEGHSGAAQG